MEQLRVIAEDVIAQERSGHSHILALDPAIRAFKLLADQRDELLKLKRATLQHAWVSEKSGRLILVPLDDDLSRIQGRIATLEGMIVANDAVTVELDAAFTEMVITPPMSELERETREIRDVISILQVSFKYLQSLINIR